GNGAAYALAGAGDESGLSSEMQVHDVSPLGRKRDHPSLNEMLPLSMDGRVVSAFMRVFLGAMPGHHESKALDTDENRPTRGRRKQDPVNRPASHLGRRQSVTPPR